MTRIGRLGQEFVERIKNKINSGAINNQNTQKTIDTFAFSQNNQDMFERLSSNGAIIDLSLELQDDAQGSCEEFMDEYAYSPTYEQEHKPTISKEVLNIIA